MIGSEGIESPVGRHILKPLHLKGHPHPVESMFTKLHPLRIIGEDRVQKILMYELLEKADDKPGDLLPLEFCRHDLVKIN